MAKINETGREEIVRAAQDIFSRYGFRKTTMEEIARAACRGKSSLYYYFKSKDEVFQAVAGREIEKWRKKLRDALGREQTPQKKLRVYFMTRMSALSHLSRFYGFFADEYYENYRLVERLKAEIEGGEFSLVREILKEGKGKGIFNIRDLDVTALNIVNVLRGLEHSWLKERNVVALKKRIDNLLDIFLKGLLKK